MKKRSIFPLVLMLLLIIFSISIYAIGSSTGNTDTTTPSTSSSESNSNIKSKSPNCEVQLTLNARIKCRLEQRGVSGLNITEESCRVLVNPANCQSLYAKVASCYELGSGKQKDRCFKHIAGFTSAKVMEQASANNKESLRNYLVFLLYDLQEKVENAYENGAITTEQASESISLIVQIKQKIFQNHTKSKIKPFFQELKAKLRGLNI
ncbi:hypothetical protein HYW75_03660 [Candidatus Pacearchaeota archaeon]|nr:hypothetical protein [Candidatus Pacearchaeota archaeon]